MNAIETKIQEILDRGFDVPSIFKSVLMKESVFTHDEEILDVVFLEREYFNDTKKSSNVFSKAKLLVATSHGLILIEEGMNEINTNYLGFKMKHIMYSKIASIELDICLLQGILKISFDSNSNTETTIEFNTSKYYRSFEEFIDVVRKKMVAYMTATV